MTTKATPNDIEVVARDVVRKYFNKFGVFYSKNADNWLTEQFIAAMQTERERCAGIAETRIAKLANDGISEGNWHELEDVAHTIRNSELTDVEQGEKETPPADALKQAVTTMRQQALQWRINVCLVPPTQYSVADVYEECAELILKCFNVELEKQDLGR